MNLKILLFFIVTTYNQAAISTIEEQAINKRQFRVVSFNLNDKLGLTTKGTHIRKLLKELDADIICLQESNSK